MLSNGTIFNDLEWRITHISWSWYYSTSNAPLRPFRSELKKNYTVPFYFIYCRLIYKSISLVHYRMPRKTFKFVPVVKKRTVEPMIVRTESLLSRAIFKNVLGYFYRGWFVVVHPCSNFSLRHQMAPLQSIKFQTADFLRTCYCDFSEQRFCCSNGQWQSGPAGFAVSQKRHYCCF